MKKALSIIGNVVLWIFLIICAIITIIAVTASQNKDGLPNIFGKAPISVQSDSMKPLFSKGDLIFGKTLSNDEKINLQVGDIITFVTDLDKNGTDELNTHEIVNVEQKDGYTYYTTQGRANTLSDEPILAQYVVAKFDGTIMPGVGSVLSFLQTQNGFMFCIVVPLILFFLFELYRFIVAIVSSKNSKQNAINEDEIKRKAVEEYLASQKQDK